MKIETLNLIAYIWLAIAVAVHITMFFITAPFGRHASEKWGPMINNKLGWFIMEVPSFAIMLYFLLTRLKSTAFNAMNSGIFFGVARMRIG